MRERIAGTKVDGSSRTTTDVGIRLLPTDDAWRIALQCRWSRVVENPSDTWPVKVRNAARYEYEAEKVITIGENGLEIAPTEAARQGPASVPWCRIGIRPRSVHGCDLPQSRQKGNQQSRPQAMAQVRSKVAQKARTRMDSEADAKLAKLEQRFHDNVLVRRSASWHSPRNRSTCSRRRIGR